MSAGAVSTASHRVACGSGMCTGNSSSGGCALAVLARAAGCSGVLLRRVPLARAALRALASVCCWLCVGLVRWLTYSGAKIVNVVAELAGHANLY